jgi:hypothetical protein
MHWLVHVLAQFGITSRHKTTSNALDPLADDKLRVLVFIDLLEIQTIVKHHIARLSECGFEAVIRDI